MEGVEVIYYFLKIKKGLIVDLKKLIVEDDCEDDIVVINFLEEDFSFEIIERSKENESLILFCML